MFGGMGPYQDVMSAELGKFSHKFAVANYSQKADEVVEI